jgi:predicted Zn finger-like uncharacterized protein
MYTECPECSTGFRVTAKVLQQAGGRVRCGGCGHAFSALDHLTEELPVPGSDIEEDAPQAEPVEEDLTSDEQLAETSRRLLKTLSELAGPEEVRIEDTGFEWQVLDEDEAEAAAEEANAEATAAGPAIGEDAPTQPAPADDDFDEQSLELVDAAEDMPEDEQFDDSSPPPEEEEIAAEAGDAEEFIATDTGIEDIADDVAANDDAPAEGTAKADEKPEDWSDLLEEEGIAAEAGIEQSDKEVAVEAAPTAADDIPLEVEEELAAIHSELSAKEDSAPGDLDSQFEMQAEAMGLEISGSHEVANDESEVEDSGIEEFAPDEEPPTVVASLDEDEDEGIAAASGIEVQEEDVAAAAEEEPAAEDVELAIVDYDGAARPEPEHKPDDELPEPSEEEMTINQQIDQELLAAAAQDQDLKATIIGLETESADTPDTLDDPFDEESADVETIIMEGDVVRGAMERELKKEKQERALKRFDKSGNLIDSYITRRAAVRGGRRSTDPSGYAAIAGALFLVLVLAGQFVHANRQALSTSNLFNQTIGPIYRMLGNPVTPEWSITGWQFEATNGSVADDQDVLTIFSRIGNRSEQPLPYPLVHVSLTDRWEEIIGSRVLEPNEYLAGDINPGELVIPGNNFTAVITIEEPSVEATGFKLNVCYRVSQHGTSSLRHRRFQRLSRARIIHE